MFIWYRTILGSHTLPGLCYGEMCPVPAGEMWSGWSGTAGPVGLWRLLISCPGASWSHQEEGRLQHSGISSRSTCLLLLLLYMKDIPLFPSQKSCSHVGLPDNYTRWCKYCLSRRGVLLFAHGAFSGIFPSLHNTTFLTLMVSCFLWKTLYLAADFSHILTLASLPPPFYVSASKSRYPQPPEAQWLKAQKEGQSAKVL